MIGPRGTLIDSFGDSIAPDTFFDPTIEEVRENPPRCFDPKTADERFDEMQVRIKQQRKQNKKYKPEFFNRNRRRKLALAIMDGDIPTRATQSETGAEASLALKLFGVTER